MTSTRVVTIEVPITPEKYVEITDAIRELNGLPVMNEELAKAGKLNVTTWSLWSNVQVAFVVDYDSPYRKADE